METLSSVTFQSIGCHTTRTSSPSSGSTCSGYKALGCSWLALRFTAWCPARVWRTRLVACASLMPVDVHTHIRSWGMRNVQEQVCEDNYSSLYRIAQALTQLQATYGTAREVKGVGTAALQLQRMLTRCCNAQSPEPY